MALPLMAYAILWDTLLDHFNPAAFGQYFELFKISPWLSAYSSFSSVILSPVSEELFFRGWMWTGLRKHWGPLATALATATVWLMLHVSSFSDFSAPIWLIPVALILSLARHFGESVAPP